MRNKGRKGKEVLGKEAGEDKATGEDNSTKVRERGFNHTREDGRREDMEKGKDTKGFRGKEQREVAKGDTKEGIREAKIGP